jgi:hypothetical protein
MSERSLELPPAISSFESFITARQDGLGKPLPATCRDNFITARQDSFSTRLDAHAGDTRSRGGIGGEEQESSLPSMVQLRIDNVLSLLDRVQNCIEQQSLISQSQNQARGVFDWDEVQDNGKDRSVHREPAEDCSGDESVLDESALDGGNYV